jgi:hypothetical protein
VDSNQHDVVAANQATLYRDLITEDVAVKAQVGPAIADSTPVTLIIGSAR